MPTALWWRAAKKNGSARSQTTDALKEQKRSRSRQNILLIKGFKYGTSLSLFVRKKIMRRNGQISVNFTLVNNVAREFDSG